MATTNDVTGDSIKTKSNSKKYRDNWDKIFKKKENTVSEEMVTISKNEYDRLKDREDKLDCLEAAGVDNWSGWDYAMELYHEGEEND